VVLVFNSTKSKYMCFKPKKYSNLYVPNMYLDGESLECVERTKYLGVLISNNSRDDDDIMRHVRGTYTRGNIMISRFKNCTNNVKHCLFRSYLSSIYAGQLWTCVSDNVMKKAIVSYNNVYRKFFNIRRGVSMSATYVTNSIDSFIVLLRKNLGSFRQRVLSCDNLLVHNIVKSVFFMCNATITVKWCKSLFA
jgi:hypothetical protein